MNIQDYLQNINLPQSKSHKGQNGKLMIIGGSELFHAASKWSLDIASKFVDMVFYGSVPSNNELIQQAKGEFWNGIVINREEIENYIEEADCILIGPGMTRSQHGRWATGSLRRDLETKRPTNLSEDDWNNDTEKVVNYLLAKYPDKKWVIDAGALQMVDPRLLNKNCIITPHEREAEMLVANLEKSKDSVTTIKDIAQQQECVTILKGEIDTIISEDTVIEVAGGNAGMTKGGTGDVLAGLIAALYCTHDALTAAVVGSYINKKAGDALYTKVGPYFNSSDLVTEIPAVLWRNVNKKSTDNN